MFVHKANSPARFVVPLACILGAAVASPARADDAPAAAPAAAPAPAAPAAPVPSLIPNGDFETLGADNWPEGWGGARPGITCEVENGNHFLRLSSQAPDQMLLTYREIKIPAGTQAVDLSWRQRITGLQRGKQSWFAPTMMLNWLDDARNKVKPGPPNNHFGKDTEGWEPEDVKFLVPSGATMLAVMPSLFRVQAGTYDLDDFSLIPTDPAPIAAATADAEAARTAKLEKVAEVRQAKAAASVGADGSIIPNGTFQDSKGDGNPDGWGSLKGNLSWQMDGNDRFLRLTSTEPGKMVMMYHEVVLPPGLKALDLSWQQRVSNLQVGAEPWFDARVLVQFLDAAGEKMPDAPSPVYTHQNSANWEAKDTQFLVPDGAVTLVFMPTLFQVQSGTLDLKEISLKPTDEAPLLAAQAARAKDQAFANVPVEAPQPDKWPEELHTSGNQILNKDGKEFWLQGVNVESLEFLVKGDHVMRSTLVAIDDWKSNVIRLPVKEEYWFGQDPTQKDGGAAYRQLVDNVITLAANRGAYVMLDLHRFRAPQQIHEDFWKDAATKYANNPAVLFDLFNEPHDISWDVWKNGGQVVDKTKAADEDAFLTPEEKAKNALGFASVGMQALVDTVRATGAKNIVIAGGLDWAYDLSGIANGFALDDKGGNGIIYATHIYAAKTDWQDKVLVIAGKYPIIVSELGANTQKFTFIPADQQEDASTWVPKVLGFIQKYHLNWTAFSLHPKSSPELITGWDYMPTPEWGALAKRALAGEQFPFMGLK